MATVLNRLIVRYLYSLITVWLMFRMRQSRVRFEDGEAVMT